MSYPARILGVSLAILICTSCSTTGAEVVPDSAESDATRLDIERNGLVLAAWLESFEDRAALEQDVADLDWTTVRELASDLPPPFKSRLTNEDAWGRDLRVAFTEAGLVIASAGEDGRTRVEEVLPSVVDRDERDRAGLSGGAWDETVREDGLGDDYVFVARHGWLFEPRTEARAASITMADLRSIATAIESFAIDNVVYPATGRRLESLEGLAGVVEPIYIKALPLTDGWNRPYLYRSDGMRYVIVSAGRDGLFEIELPEDLAALTLDTFGGATLDPDRDVVFVNGQFVQWPSKAGQ